MPQAAGRISGETRLQPPRNFSADQKDWRELCTAVVNETDFNKLSSLVQNLVEALDEGRQNMQRRIETCGENLESA